jgi:hypothetical protein
MHRRYSVFGLAVLAFFPALPLSAQVAADSVSLGLSAGVGYTFGSTPQIVIAGTDSPLSFNWGFYVNIPLIYTFHITPSAELYKLGIQNATDFDLAFKFIVPLADFSLFGGVSPGITSVTDVLALHAGFLLGGTFHLVSNLEIFVLGKYTFVFEGGANLGVLHLNAGILFSF